MPSQEKMRKKKNECNLRMKFVSCPKFRAKIILIEITFSSFYTK